MAEDFRAIRRVASSLDPHVPTARAWTKIAAAVEQERHRGFLSRIVGSGSIAWQPLAVAATLMVLLGGSSWMVWRQLTPARTAAPTAAQPGRPSADPELVQSVETELRLAEEHYQKAIAGLEQITKAESSALDPQVAAVLQKNLSVIDQAIGESRAALQTQPTSEVAQESLFGALRSKVTLLQETVGLINEMRKGNQEGAARIVSGLNQ